MHPRVIAPLDTPAPGSRQGRTIYADEHAGARLALSELVVRRGNEPPLHRHQHEDLVMYVLDGELTFYLDGSHLPATGGACVVLPRGTEHGYTIHSDQARLLVILTPAGAEEYLAVLHDHSHPGPAVADDSAGGLERLIATAARYGIDITGPCPSGNATS